MDTRWAADQRIPRDTLANAKQRMQLLTSLVKMPVKQNPLLLLQGIGTYDANYGGNGFDEKPQLSANFCDTRLILLLF